MKSEVRKALESIERALEKCQDQLETILQERLDDETRYSLELAVDYIGDALTELDNVLEE